MDAKQILIVGGDIDGNLGDSAIAASLVEEIGRINPLARVGVVSNNDSDEQSVRADQFIVRGPRGGAALIVAAARSDTVICGGGGLFQDDDSLIKMPYWALRLAFLRLFAAHMVGFSIGAGPLRWRPSQIFARFATAMLDAVSVRDHFAQQVLQQSCAKPVAMVPDPAFLLPAASEHDANWLLEGAGVPMDGRPLIGIAVRRCFNTGGWIPHQLKARLRLKPRGESRMAKLHNRLVAALRQVIDETGAHLVFMPSYRSSYENDSQTCRILANALPNSATSLVEISDARLYKAVTQRLDAVLAGRMHPAILAAGAGTPSIALAYNQKFLGTFELLNQAGRCFDVAEFADSGDPGKLAKALIAAMADTPSDRNALRNAANSLAAHTREYLRACLSANEFESANTANQSQP